MFPVSNGEKRAAETLLRSSGKKQRVSAAAVLTAIAFHRIKDGMYVSARAAGDDIGLSSRQRQELRRQVAGWHGTTKTLDQTPRELLRDQPTQMATSTARPNLQMCVAPSGEPTSAPSGVPSVGLSVASSVAPSSVPPSAPECEDVLRAGRKRADEMRVEEEEHEEGSQQQEQEEQQLVGGALMQLLPGVHILRAAVERPLCVQTMRRLRATPPEASYGIVNGSVKAPCGKRRGVPMAQHEWPIVRAVESALQQVGEMEGRLLGGATGLVRQKGCKKGKWHTDFPSFPVELERKPRTAWVVLESGNELEFGLMSSMVAVRLLAAELNVGDIIIFDGDVPHRGTEFYKKSRVAMHVYMDVPGVQRETDPNAQGSFKVVQGFRY